jgi:hypothetical protein
MSRGMQPITEQTVMDNVGITAVDVERRKRFVGLGPADLQNLADIKPVITKNVGVLVDAFFVHLANLDEAKVLLGYKELTNQARALKREHLLAMVEGTYDLKYVQQRISLGLLYVLVWLPT